MKVEFYVEGPNRTAAFVAFLPLWNEAVAKDYEGLAPVSDEPAPAKKSRSRNAKEPVEAPEPTPAIRATPENRQPVEDAEVISETSASDVFDDAPAETPMTREDVKLALAAYADKFGMAKAQAEGPKLMGAPRLSALPDDPETFAKAVKALREAVDNG